MDPLRGCLAGIGRAVEAVCPGCFRVEYVGLLRHGTMCGSGNPISTVLESDSRYRHMKKDNLLGCCRARLSMTICCIESESPRVSMF